jgi:predicted Rossmann fold nucleotide-binding protein DprA/Smf involved in DNA uptake
MEFGREVFDLPGDATQPVRFAPNQLIKQGAKLVTNAEGLMEGLPTPVRAALVNLMQPGTGQANLLVAAFLTPNEKSCTTCSIRMSRNRLMTSLSGPA